MDTINLPSPMDSLDALKRMGFTGFTLIRNLCDTNCSDVPQLPGVYMVVRTQAGSPIFLESSEAGRFKGKDPSVTIDVLRSNWVNGTPVLYIGKAGGSKSNATLRKRIRQYMQFGSGKPIGHWGGRFIWQLSDAQQLLVCWRPTDTEEPATVETALIAAFEGKYGKRPFANLRS